VSHFFYCFCDCSTKSDISLVFAQKSGANYGANNLLFCDQRCYGIKKLVAFAILHIFFCFFRKDNKGRSWKFDRFLYLRIRNSRTKSTRLRSSFAQFEIWKQQNLPYWANFGILCLFAQRVVMTTVHQYETPETAKLHIKFIENLIALKPTL